MKGCPTGTPDPPVCANEQTRHFEGRTLTGLHSTTAACAPQKRHAGSGAPVHKDNHMQTSTLHHLVNSLADARDYQLTCALLEIDPVRRERPRRQAETISAILDAVRRELCIRATRSRRSPDDARRADRDLKRLLADFLDLGPPGEAPPTAIASPGTEAARHIPTAGSRWPSARPNRAARSRYP